MTDDGDAPVPFAPIGKAWGFRIVVYGIILPFGAALVAILLASLLAIGFEDALKGSPGAGCLLLLTMFVGPLVLIGYLGARDFRWRFPTHVAISPDAIEWGRGRRRHRVGWDEVAELHLASWECGLRTIDGRGFSLRSEEWPVTDVRDALLERAVPRMAEAAARRLAAGESLRFGTRRRKAVLALAVAIILVFLGLVLGAGALANLRLPRAALYLGIGSAILLGAAWSVFRSAGRLATNRLVLEKGGLRPSGSTILEWSAMGRMEQDAECLRIERTDGAPCLRIERALTNYPVLVALLRKNLPA